ncbi:hypothetical protein V8E53_012828 [Lactarius tabidus]
MNTQRAPVPLPKFKFRVLIIGRANAGKTSILQRVCETTESPIVYKGRQQVKLHPSMNRGEHNINDELVFSNHRGYIFHDSRGIEAGSTEELGILQEFIRRKCQEKQLQLRLHAIWYCVPMDNQRPQLDLKFYKDICPDKNVPVIVVFTKYDQFLRNVGMLLSDYPNEFPGSNVSEAAEKHFQEHYLRPLGNDVRYVQLEKMHKKSACCDDLIEKTGADLNRDTVALMLLAVQKGNLELSVKVALRRAGFRVKRAKSIVQECLSSFPYLWWWPFLVTLKLSDHPSLFDAWYFNLFIFNVYLTFVVAAIIIFKHATYLRITSATAESALTQAEVDYRTANIELKIEQHLMAPSQEHSVEQFAHFIMTTDGLFMAAIC